MANSRNLKSSFLAGYVFQRCPDTTFLIGTMAFHPVILCLQYSGGSGLGSAPTGQAFAGVPQPDPANEMGSTYFAFLTQIEHINLHQCCRAVVNHPRLFPPSKEGLQVLRVFLWLPQIDSGNSAYLQRGCKMMDGFLFVATGKK